MTQTVAFHDEIPDWASGLNSSIDTTRLVNHQSEFDLDSFFKRPIQIASYDWTPGTTDFYQALDPWTLYLSNSRIVNRISNYLNFTMTLKIKIMINGSPFAYGRLIANYLPYQDLNNWTPVDGLTWEAKMLASQQMHIFIDPTNGQGGTLTLPFISRTNQQLTTSATTIADMGRLYLRELTPLKHTGGATTPFTISIYAWAEDVNLSVPTQANAANIVAQSSEDEYGDRPVSKVASAIAEASGSLSQAPVIGPYARATSLAAGAMATVAKAFGYSAPAMIENHTPIRPHATTRMANTDRQDDVSKLTVDSKQELSIDPKIIGAQLDDELSIVNIASRSTLITKFDWDLVPAGGNKVLWAARVSPMLPYSNTDVAGTYYTLPACSYAAMPFKYWRGSMIFRFQVVASAYHRGRLMITYDPWAADSNPLVNPETNVGFTRIVDIENERDFEVEVGWGQYLAFLPMPELAASSTYYGTSPFSTYSQPYNGTITVSILTDLTQPTTTVGNDISVNVFARTCDDIEFAEPRGDVLSTLSYYGNTQSDVVSSIRDSARRVVLAIRESCNCCARDCIRVEVQSEEVPVVENEPQDPSTIQTISKCLEPDITNVIYFGERITSFRQLLKRYSYFTSAHAVGAAAVQLWKFARSDFPKPRGWSTIADNVDGTAGKVNYSNTTLLNYLSFAFLTRRGGIRYKYVLNTESGTGNTSMSVVRRTHDSTNQTTDSLTTLTTTTTHTYAMASVNGKEDGFAGTEVQHSTVNPVVEIEIPDYNNTRFHLCPYVSATSDAGNYGTFHQVEVVLENTQHASLDSYVCGAEDLSFSLFIGCPPLRQITLTA